MMEESLIVTARVGFAIPSTRANSCATTCCHTFTMNYENKFDYTVVKAEHDGLLCKSRGIAFIDFTLSTPMINVNTVPMNN